jgi:hypothetical protein
MPRIAWLAAVLFAGTGCAQVPGTIEAPASREPWRAVAQAKAHPELRPQISELEARLRRLNELQGGALAAAMWNDVKDKTMDQVRILNKTWREQPKLFLENWDKMLAQVENKTAEALQSLAAQLPVDMGDKPPSGM